ncbi:hypothetical protein Tco_1256392 [Tanacetum coccineum]
MKILPVSTSNSDAVGDLRDSSRINLCNLKTQCGPVWRLPPRGRTVDDLSAMTNLIGNLRLTSNDHDKWEWACDNLGLFKTNCVLKCVMEIESERKWVKLKFWLVLKFLKKVKAKKSEKKEWKFFWCLVQQGYHKWNSWIPRKINICVWRAACDRLPTRINLLRRGVPLPSSSCTIVLSLEKKLGMVEYGSSFELSILCPGFGLRIFCFARLPEDKESYARGLFVLQFGVFGYGEMKLSMQSKVRLLEFWRKTCSLSFKGFQNLGSRPDLRRV